MKDFVQMLQTCAFPLLSWTLWKWDFNILLVLKPFSQISHLCSLFTWCWKVEMLLFAIFSIFPIFSFFVVHSVSQTIVILIYFQQALRDSAAGPRALINQLIFTNFIITEAKVLGYRMIHEFMHHFLFLKSIFKKWPTSRKKFLFFQMC